MRATRRCRGTWRAALLLTVTTFVVALPAAASAGTNDGLHVSATVDGRDVRTIDANAPLRLHADATSWVTLTIGNGGTRPVTVQSVRLDGRVLTLTFFSYETRLDAVVAPGGREQRRIPLELVGLKGQATGLLPGRVTLLGDHRQTLYSTSFPVDARGSLWSVYGLFYIVVAAITLLLLTDAFSRRAMQRLSANRWRRASRFGIAGIGLGLTLALTLSVLRVLTP